MFRSPNESPPSLTVRGLRRIWKFNRLTPVATVGRVYDVPPRERRDAIFCRILEDPFEIFDATGVMRGIYPQIPPIR